MTLALTLGMTVGLRNTLWMMYGELLGVATVALTAVLGVSAILLQYPGLFAALKIVGALYLLWIGINMWREKGKLVVTEPSAPLQSINQWQLFNQGFITAIANPKGWAFMVSLLPPFINPSLPLPFQLSMLIGIILISEFVCMMLYATGGRSLVRLLKEQHQVRKLNRISGGLMMAVAIWLALS